jgi:predicted RNase H-like HicB family nuclease
MTKYEVIIYWSADDQAFIAEVPELPGCAADGATQQAALKNELGRPIPKPKGRLVFA